MHESEAETIQRALIVGWELSSGERLTTVEVAARFKIHHTTAWRLLELASGVLPIVSEVVDSRSGLLIWYRMDM